MNILRYVLKKQKMYLCTTCTVFILGIIFVFWGIDVHDQIVKNTILLSVGTSLLAGGIVAALDMFRNAGQKQIYHNIDNIIFRAGVENIYEKRDLDEYDKLIKRAEHSIDVLGYSLRAFYQSYRDILIEKTGKNADFKIRILLVNPDSVFSKDREANEDGKANGIYKNSFEVIKAGFAENKNIQIKTINTPIGYMIYRIDDVMYVGPYFYKKNSKSTNTMRLDKSGWLYREYQREFDNMWKDSE